MDIPIVFSAAADPVGTGLVDSLARPGGNVTGVSLQQTDLASKRLELLLEIVPNLRRLGVIVNVGNPGAVVELRELNVAATVLRIKVDTLAIRRAEDIAPAFEAAKGQVDALYVGADPLVNATQSRINALAREARLPTIYNGREYVKAGGLISYGPNVPDLYRRAADIVDKILRGAKPADLPVQQPTKFDLIINLTTAKALGLSIPESFLLRADEVIE